MKNFENSRALPVYGDISKNRHISAYGKGANIALCMQAKPQRVTFMKTFFWDMKGEIMQLLQFKHFGWALKIIVHVIQFVKKKNESDFCDIFYHWKYLWQE